MTSVSTLVSVNDIICTFGHSWNLAQLNEYIVYQLKPYLGLHIFTYFDFKNTNPPVDGRIEPISLLNKINSLKQQQTSRIMQLQSALPNNYTWEILRKIPAGKELLELLAGVLTIKSKFYDITTKSSYIGAKIISSVNQMPQKYILTEINLHN